MVSKIYSVCAQFTSNKNEVLRGSNMRGKFIGQSSMGFVTGSTYNMLTDVQLVKRYILSKEN